MEALIGGAGDDTYVLRSTGDVLSDVAGNDTAILVTELAHALAAGANAVVALAGGMPPAEPWLAPITLELAPGIENLTAIVWERSWSMSFDLVGNEGTNRLIGDSFANVLVGNGGDDTLFGHGGDDRLDGGTGDDARTRASSTEHLIVGRTDPGCRRMRDAIHDAAHTQSCEARGPPTIVNTD